MHTSKKAPTRLEPMKGCGISGILKGTVGIKDALPIIHGPVSCSSGYRMVPLLAELEPVIPTTALTDSELIMGTQDRLGQALNKAWNIYKPKLVVVILTCATSLVGENFDTIIQDFEQDKDCTALVIDGSGIAGEESDGFKALYENLQEKIMNGKESYTFPQKGISLDGLSLIDYAGKENYFKLIELIEENCGLRLGKSLFMDFSIKDDIDEYRKNRIVHVGGLWELQKERCFAPFGVEGTFRWLEWFCKTVEMELSPKATSNYMKEKEKWNKLLISDTDFENMKVVVEGDSWWALGLGDFLKNELHCKIMLCTDIAGFDIHEKKPFADQCYADVGGFELNLLCEDFQPNIVFGSSNSHNDKWEWIPFTQPIWHVVDKKETYIGYDGAFNILDTLQRMREEKS